MRSRVYTTSLVIALLALMSVLTAGCGGNASGAGGTGPNTKWPVVLNGGYNKEITLPDGWRITLTNFRPATSADAFQGNLYTDGANLQIVAAEISILNGTGQGGVFERNHSLKLQDSYGTSCSLPALFLAADPSSAFLFVFTNDPSSPYYHPFDVGQRRNGADFFECSASSKQFTLTLSTGGYGGQTLVQWHVSLGS